MTWIFLSIAAAAFQTLRFMLQKILSMGTLTTSGATYARFLFAVPFIGALTFAYLWNTGADFPSLSTRFWVFAFTGGLAQILATWAMVALFARRNFAVGITFKKTEVVQAALIGLVVLGDCVSLFALAAILLGMVGVVILSTQPGTGKWWAKIANPTAGLGLLAGAIFAISAVGYRGATLEIPGDSALMRGLVTLFVVSLSQTVAMGIWLRLHEPGTLTNVARSWRTSIWMGLAGMAGSLCWFTAFSLQSAAYVFAVGQVEVIFSILVSGLYFHERITRREVSGIALVTLSIMGLVAVI